MVDLLQPPRSFFARDPVTLARELIGAYLIHHQTSGIIVETEAYLGRDDAAAHSAAGKTKRTEVLFGPAGYAYVYFIYGLYECFNIVAESEGQAGCVLIRALQPESGIELMQQRRPAAKRIHDLASGPAKLTLAMGITRDLNGADLLKGPLTVRLPQPRKELPITVTPRIGITKCADLPLRFYLTGNPCVSRAKRASGDIPCASVK